jgi:heme exporter protein CcmD
MAILGAPCAAQLDSGQKLLKYGALHPVMNWSSVSAFLEMGGYAGFVWGSYGVTALCIAAEVTLLMTRERRLKRGMRD